MIGLRSNLLARSTIQNMMGIPPEWSTVEKWLDTRMPPSYRDDKDTPLSERKFKEVPLLANYDVIPEASFWDNFPFRDLPARAETRINARNLEKTVDKYKNEMLQSEFKRATKVIEDLKHGANAYQKSVLPPITVQNTRSALHHGALITDKIASWVNDGYVAGPFDSPPMPGFRANPLMAVVRNGKVRPVLNMSGPKGSSFNDNIDLTKLEKVHMDTAKTFGYKLKEIGINARFSKFDYKDAYKTIPSKPADYRLQGFKWLGKYFCETQQTFGGIPSVCNFDREGNTLKTVATLASKVPRDTVLRILDDTSNIGKPNTTQTDDFARAMENICGFVNMPLAPICPLKEKAFVSETSGVVMGIGFDSTNLTWFLPEEKADRTIKRCMDVFHGMHASLKQMEQVMGSVNDLAQMAPFARFYKNSGQELLRSFLGNYDTLKQVPSAVREDMLVLAKIADTARLSLPIPSRPCNGPLTTLTFYSDAAGASFSMVNGEKIFHSSKERGVACLGGDSIQSIWVWSRLVWPSDFITVLKDSKGKHFGNKSTTLECFGILLPMISFPEKIAGKFIKFKVDNMAVVYGWNNGYVKFDSNASEVLRAVNVAASYLGVKVYIKHVPRMSEEMASLADKLSRTASDSRASSKLFASPKMDLSEWFRNPVSDGSLARLVLTNLKTVYPI